MSERLREIADRLSEIAEGLREQETEDELAAEAGTEADRVLREVSPDE